VCMFAKGKPGSPSAKGERLGEGGLRSEGQLEDGICLEPSWKAKSLSKRR